MMKRFRPGQRLRTPKHTPPEDKQHRNRRWKQKHYQWYNLAVWRNGSKQFLQRNPLCVICKDAGRIVPSTEVDHVVPHRGEWELFIDSDNWQACCHTCHSRKTAKENGGIAQTGGARLICAANFRKSPPSLRCHNWQQNTIPQQFWIARTSSSC